MSSSIPESPPEQQSATLQIIAANPLRRGDHILLLDERGEGSPYGVSIYDCRGRIVNRLSPREHGRLLRWDPFNDRDRDLGSGVYFVVVGVDNVSVTASRRIVLVR